MDEKLIAKNQSLFTTARHVKLNYIADFIHEHSALYNILK